MLTKEQQYIIQKWKNNGETIVFTNGCFDILHLGHVDYLTKAKALGSKLVLGLNSDASVKKLGKGISRPIQSETARKGILEGLKAVDLVIVFSEETPKNLIENIVPNVLVKGGDYTKETIVGADFVENNGGKVEVIPFLEGYSTSSIEQKILASFGKG